MSISVEVSVSDNIKVEGWDAPDIEPNQLFKDSDGDVHLRVEDGSIWFADGDMGVYSNHDLENHYFFKSCTLIRGNVDVKVTVLRE